MQRSCVVVATSDKAPLLRIKAAFCATAIAEYFRDQGKDVLFMMDSVTRLAMAQRELGLAVGEPPTTRGYTPSVFALLPRLMERTGTSGKGTITALYTVLVEGDDMNDPIADTARSILDGHIVLSRKLSFEGHYPAIDVLQSVSRLMPEITEKRHQQFAQRLREVLAVYREAEDLVNIGAYERGSNPRIDYALSMIDKVKAFLRQSIEEHFSFEETLGALGALFEEA
jgi:FliI/YscN family ATPase